MKRNEKDPTISLRKAILIWAAHYILFFTLWDATAMADNIYGKLLLTIYVSGHFLLVLVIILSGKLKIAFPIDKSWVDVLVVTSAMWIGPLWWYQIWRQRMSNGLAEPNSQDDLGKLLTFGHWTTILLFVCLFLLLLTLLTWTSGLWRP